MLRYCIALFVLITATGCNNDTPDLSGTGPVKAGDFVHAFSELSTPLRFSDTGLYATGDTLRISYAVLHQFIPDSVLQKCLGANAMKFTIIPAGKIEKEKKEKYLLVKFTLNKKIKLCAFVLGTDNKYLSYLDLLANDNADKYAHYVSVTSEPTFIMGREKNVGGELRYTKNGFAWNEEAKAFIAVVNDTNEDMARVNEVINPIDTFPRKNKYSGDYVSDAKNFISLRDGKNESTYLFFFHFDRNNGDCTGEIKSAMALISPGKALFHENGDPCSIEFTISNTSIHIKEDGNCGNYRGITCLIDYTYSKKKDKRTTTKKAVSK